MTNAHQAETKQLQELAEHLDAQRTEIEAEQSSLAELMSETELARGEAEDHLARAATEAALVLEESHSQVTDETAKLGLRRQEMEQERHSIDVWRKELSDWRARLDKERATLDAGKSLVEQDRVGLRREIDRIENHWAEVENTGSQFLERAQLEADAIIERAWSEARRVIDHTDDDGTDDVAKLAELRAELEKQRAAFDKHRIEHEQSQARLELERAKLAADRAAFDELAANQGAGDDDGAISDGMSELEKEFAQLDDTSPEPAAMIDGKPGLPTDGPLPDPGDSDADGSNDSEGEVAPGEQSATEETDNSLTPEADLSEDESDSPSSDTKSKKATVGVPGKRGGSA